MQKSAANAAPSSVPKKDIGNFQAAKEGWLVLLASDPKLSASDLAVGIVIAKHINSKSRRAWPSLMTMAMLTNRHVSTVWKSVRKLHRKGLLEIHKGRGRHQFNRYELRLGNLDHDPKPMQRGNKNCAEQQEKDCGDDQLTSSGSAEELMRRGALNRELTLDKRDDPVRPPDLQQLVAKHGGYDKIPRFR